MTEGVELLKASYLFRDLPEKILEQVASRLVFDTYGPREVIFREGADGDTLFLLAEGEVEVRKKDRESGIEFHLTRMEAPAAFGEIALLKSGPRSATVATISDTRVAMLRGPDFSNMVSKLPEFALSLARGLAGRVDELSRERRMSYGQLSNMSYDSQVLGMLPKKVLMHLKIVPLGYNGTSLSVAVVNPEDVSGMDQLRQLVRGVLIEPVVVSESDFKRFMDTVYDRVTGTQKAKSDEDKSGTKIDINDLMEELDKDLRELHGHDEQTVVKLARNLLIQAIRRSATEMYIESKADKLLVRCRVNTQLETLSELQRGMHRDLIARFKAMANLDVEITDQPQHGLISIIEGDVEVFFNVDTLPTRFGEKLAISLPESGSIPALENIILTKDERSSLSRLLTAPYGLVLVLGPAGSGKTTTLYSLLRQMSERGLNAYAIGARQAYDLEGVSRIETGRTGIDVATALEAALAQRPDVVLLEDLPDARTVKLAIDAALTGHLVLSAFSATHLDAALVRNETMGVNRDSLLEALAGVITQRLVRKLCPNCRESYEPDAPVIQRLGLSNYDSLYRPTGCTVCEHTGFRGRVGIHEVLPIDTARRILLKRQTPMVELYEAGQRSLKDSGLDLLRSGLTTPQELVRELML